MDIMYDLKFNIYSNKSDLEKSLMSSLYTHILFADRGNITFSCCGKSKLLSEQESLIVFPCSDFSVTALAGNQPCIIEISYLITGNDIIIPNADFPIICPPDSELSAIIKDYINYSHEIKMPFSLKRKALEYSIMHLTESKLLENGRNIPEKLAYVLLYIHNNYSENFSVEELAGFAKTSTAGLYNLFYNTLKTSPKQYIRKYRMTRAVNLIANTDKTISEISLETGFYDQFYFSKEFKKDFGISPSEYRKQNNFK